MLECDSEETLRVADLKPTAMRESTLQTEPTGSTATSASICASLRKTETMRSRASESST